MIDQATLEKLQRIQERAVREGRSFWELLDESGLLATEDRRAEIWSECLTELYLQVQDQGPVVLVLLGGGQNTPLDAYQGILKFIDFFKTVRTGR